MAQFKESSQDKRVDVDLISLKLAIEEAAQCPICLELFKPPVSLCINGHGTCNVCRGVITECPTCREPFSTVEARILNEILGKIPNICINYDKGCRSLATNEHELYCKFRTVECIFHDKDNLRYCGWKGPAKEFDVHVENNEHLEPGYARITDSTAFIPSANGQSKIYFDRFTEFSSKKSLLPTQFLDKPIQNEILIITHTKIDGNFCLYMNHFPLEKPESTIFFTLFFENSAGKVLYQYKMKATEATMLDQNVNERSAYCMRVPLEELEKLVDKDGNLYVRFEVFNENNDTPTTRQGNASTQVEKCLLKMHEEPPANKPEPVDQSAMEVNTETTPVVDSSDSDCDDIVLRPTAMARPLPDTLQNNSTSDHWQDIRSNRRHHLRGSLRGSVLGFGRGKKTNDPDHLYNYYQNRQDYYNRPIFHPNNPYNGGWYSNLGPRYQKNIEERDHQNRRNFEDKDNVNRRNNEER